MIPRRPNGILLSVLVLVVAVYCTTRWREWTEPRYQGKRLSEWLPDMPLSRDYLLTSSAEEENPENAAHQAAVVAIQAMGPGAVPYLLADVERAKRTRLDRLFSWLHLDHFGAFQYGPRLDTSLRALTSLCVLGGDASGAQSRLRRWTTRGLSSQACLVLDYMGPAADGTVRAVICDTNVFLNARLSCIHGLSKGGRTVEERIEILRYGFDHGGTVEVRIACAVDLIELNSDPDRYIPFIFANVQSLRLELERFFQLVSVAHPQLGRRYYPSLKGFKEKPNDGRVLREVYRALHVLDQTPIE